MTTILLLIVMAMASTVITYDFYKMINEIIKTVKESRKKKK